MIEKFERASRNLKTSIRDAFLQTQEDYVELNLDQMLHGITSDGFVIGLYENEAYAIEKHIRNPLAGYGIVDLRDEGNFYAATYMSLNGNIISIQSADPKDPQLEKKYSTKIWGLTYENRRKYIQVYYAPNLIKKLGL